MTEMQPNRPQKEMVCSSCGKRLRFKDELAGKRVKCPNCGQTVVLAAAPQPTFQKTFLVEGGDVPESYDELRDDSRQLERVRNLVLKPAIALLVVGFLGLALDLFIAGFGFVDDFITPLSPASKERSKEAVEQDRENAVAGITLLLGLAVASGIAIWAGFNMIKLKRYGVSITGSFAVMLGGGFCCLVGLPVGIWSLIVLFKPEVRSSFH